MTRGTAPQPRNRKSAAPRVTGGRPVGGGRETDNALDACLAALRTLRVGCATDEIRDLHGAVAACLEAAGLKAQHEYRIQGVGRLDFWVPPGIAIEIKRGRPSAPRLWAQVRRYIKSPEISAVVVVVQRAVPMPTGRFPTPVKPMRLVCLDRLWGIAL